VRIVYKYKVEANLETQPISIPVDSQILKVGVQEGDIYIWAWEDPAMEHEDRQIEVYGTGQWMSDGDFNRVHLGTVEVGVFIWHVFEKVAPKYQHFWNHPPPGATPV